MGNLQFIQDLCGKSEVVPEKHARHLIGMVITYQVGPFEIARFPSRPTFNSPHFQLVSLPSQLATEKVAIFMARSNNRGTRYDKSYLKAHMQINAAILSLHFVILPTVNIS